jgi:ppGpp synthetase/RelA/SpoT-type nucleotidyltranferase
MDFWASLDHKIGYKLDDMPDELRKEMYLCAKEIKELDKQMFKIKKKAEKYKREHQ